MMMHAHIILEYYIEMGRRSIQVSMPRLLQPALKQIGSRNVPQLLNQARGFKELLERTCRFSLMSIVRTQRHTP
jgi:hypothetical protein